MEVKDKWIGGVLLKHKYHTKMKMELYFVINLETRISNTENLDGPILKCHNIISLSLEIDIDSKQVPWTNLLKRYPPSKK